MHWVSPVFFQCVWKKSDLALRKVGSTMQEMARVCPYQTLRAGPPGQGGNEQTIGLDIYGTFLGCGKKSHKTMCSFLGFKGDILSLGKTSPLVDLMAHVFSLKSGEGVSCWPGGIAQFGVFWLWAQLLASVLTHSQSSLCLFPMPSICQYLLFWPGLHSFLPSSTPRPSAFEGYYEAKFQWIQWPYVCFPYSI